MTKIVTTKKNRKKQSPFEKLWARALKKKKSNERLRSSLDEIVVKMQGTVLPREIVLAETQRPLLNKLLTLGQRKSMTNWEREALDDWIRMMVQDFQTLGVLNDEVLDNVARYDAFRMGIDLEDEDIPPHKQFMEILRENEEEQRRLHKAEMAEDEEFSQAYREQLVESAKANIEKKLDKSLGRRPEPKESGTADLWEDDLRDTQDRLISEYDTKRKAMYEELLAQEMEEIERTMSMFADEDDLTDFGIPDFDELFDEMFGEDDSGAGRGNAGDSTKDDGRDPAFTNDTFQRLFRSTAAKLHPDREPDPEIRAEKQKLMATLLKARKSGDIMTVLELYESWVGKHDGFSKADQKALQATLEAWIDTLDGEVDAILTESPDHFRAYQEFHSTSKRKIDRAFEERLDELTEAEQSIKLMVLDITSLKSLKPYLEQRYEESRFGHSFFLDDLDDLDEFDDFIDLDDDYRY